MTSTLETGRSTLTRDERTKLRMVAARRRRRNGWIACLLVLLIGAGGAYVLWGTPVLGVKTVSVTSASGQELPPELVAQVESVAAISVGAPLISLDIAKVREAVLTVGSVAAVQVSRRWPSSVIITVTPRVPVAVVAANSALFLMDDSGFPYLETPSVPAGLVTLRLATPGPEDAATRAGLTVISALPAEISARLTSVSARSVYDISLDLADGREVKWGSADNSARKAAVLPAVLAQPGTKFDLSDPAMVTVR
ncbi:FtsQ-type POTRA domain-containing protein [Nakamurella antarctica]|uniref:FtsQ-type POTRA domain-containing protein n=1 Tax=Nakamurella antarctica TaxID=1902245 RepID=A0A3G8ZJZ9_9ACTN|nr:FtsQ-type POTRA domain-containing protein [Nakamurella antarctica]AZI57669.1 FtsQ-type POTRA domain-containing protein [Nakamurella antarctica]